jgi:hypothetical protein
MSDTTISYTQLTRWAPECVKRFGKIHEIPIILSGYKECRHLYHGGKVLDVGAGVTKPLKQALALDDKNYFSLDNDPEGKFDFTSFGEIPPGMKFDLIVLNQILEHLTIDESVIMIQHVDARLADRGHVFISVPNMQHPVRFWGHALHITPWPYDHLYGLVRHCGLDVVAIARSNKFSPPLNPIKKFIIGTVCEVFRIDWCDSILLVAKKNNR